MRTLSPAATARIAAINASIAAMQTEMQDLLAGKFMPYMAEIPYRWGHESESVMIRSEEEAIVAIFKAYMEVRYCSRREALRRLTGRVNGKFLHTVRALCESEAVFYPGLRATFRKNVAQWCDSIGSKGEEVAALLMKA